MNLLLRTLATTGAGYTHSSGVHCNFLAFADDIVLLTDDPRKMQTLVHEIERFAHWSRMWVNLSKCRISAIDFNTGKTLETNHIQFSTPNTPARPFPPLDPNAPYKYLGYHISLTLNWHTHKDTVLEKIDSAIDCLRDSVYLPTQLEEMV